MSKKIDVETMQAIFVAGQSRSGTTLLQGQICNSEATIESTAECSYFRHLIQAYAIMLNGGYALHAEDYFDNDLEKIKLQRKVIKPYFDHLKQRFGNGIPVQKEPTMMAYFPEIGLLMPNSVFVATVRDPRDILTSQLKRIQKNGQQGLNYETWQHNQFSRLARMLQGKEILKDRMFFVRYESLCANPKRCLMELNGYLKDRGYKLNLDKNTEDTSWETKRDEKYESASDLDGKPVSTQSIGSYKDMLKSDVLNAIDKLRPFLSEQTGFDWFCADDMDKIEDYPAVIPLA